MEDSFKLGLIIPSKTTNPNVSSFFFPEHFQAIMSEAEASNQAIEPYITEDIDTNDYVEATYECENINNIGVNIEFDEDDVNDERILGKDGQRCFRRMGNDWWTRLMTHTITT
uniref:Uncharacterized protein n=1 Tax=Lactuca sativa TaxID=4236 RepID=A0A9R1VDN1_LACSA|nr:hypothetical protein LSAT_V11C500292600 [Lactuca sativa]